MRITSGPRVLIYTDGGCDPNPGPGGWGAVLVHKLQTHELSGADPATTNNRMELTAAISALEALKKPCDILLMTDSQYLKRGITEWLENWRRRGWRKRDGRPVENADLWKRLDKATFMHSIEWRWVKGHSGDALNERADRLATRARERLLAGGEQAVTKEIEKTPARAEKARRLPRVKLVARGCALGVPGPAGYACVVVAGKKASEVSGQWPMATSNLMELWAVIKGLQSLQQVSNVTIYTGSKYVLQGGSRWLAGWERNGWRTSSNKLVSNREAWQELIRVMGDHDITWRSLDDTVLDESRAAAKLARQEAERARDDAE